MKKKNYLFNALGKFTKYPIMHHDYIEKVSLFVIDEEMKENLNIIEEIDKKLNDPEIKVEDNEKEALKKELKAINSVFYCSLCNKQYSKISEYEQHLDSYDHNHKKRFLDMRKTEKLNNKKREGDKKRLKEQKRQEKEMQQLADFANKQQGIIGSSITTINASQGLDLEKGILLAEKFNHKELAK